ncbi:RNA-directed DNA polymerase (reverse transcriptase)-related family protein [Rhynchospora pubera]|uniref:RNA-directed DNA polymerase (Reverse transcriptase)-related family protein n=1 Tax=Rhynchospora pubera TaxID=906938 RepID=A0AAV8EXV9_9POAL|nr:RNA-directed DNA polymerase (reverse transcriptase)-related family protein [Rhynchospora pubera]
MLSSAADTLSDTLSPKFDRPFQILQYADDTLLFAPATPPALQALKTTLELFSTVSGLSINFAKSCFVPVNLQPSLFADVQSVLQCSPAELPVTYLGLPLTLKRPTRQAYHDLIQKIEKRLQGWKSKLLSRAGRIQLAASVISSIPIYFLSVFLLPKWVLNSIDKLRRQFIWGESSAITPLNWTTVCLPKALGGFGLRNLQLQNITLLIRWWWRLYGIEDSIWAQIAGLIYKRAGPLVGPMMWISAGSFFWHQLRSIRFYFQLFTRWTVGDGNAILVWVDNWRGSPLHFFLSAEKWDQQHKLLTLRQAVALSHSLFQSPLTRSDFELTNHLNRLHLRNTPDLIRWTLTRDGIFSSSSAYKSLIFAGKIRSQFAFIWHLKITPSVKYFGILLMRNRLPTRSRLHNMRVLNEATCPLCDTDDETHLHLFFTCQVTRAFWHHFSNLTGLHMPPAASSVSDVIFTFRSSLPVGDCSRDLSFLFTALHIIWRARNAMIFRDETRTPLVLAGIAAIEAKLIFKNA